MELPENVVISALVISIILLFWFLRAILGLSGGGNENKPQEVFVMPNEMIGKFEKLIDLKKQGFITDVELEREKQKLREDFEQADDGTGTKKGISNEDLDKLKRLGGLLRGGGISDSDFDAQKRAILK